MKTPLQRLKLILKLVEIDDAEDWSCKAAGISKKPFTQDEAKRMANIIGNVYTEAHKISCKACRD